ncbi:MAG TPA: hypothetical protein VIC05_08180 [Solirubrobacteraceae bacterium]
MSRSMQALGGDMVKRYRVYERPLPEDSATKAWPDFRGRARRRLVRFRSCLRPLV